MKKDKVKSTIARLSWKHRKELAEEIMSAKLRTEKKMLLPGFLAPIHRAILDGWKFYISHLKD